MLFPPRRALVISPSATHPRDYGNRNRVWQTTRFLQRLGYEITFMLYPFEADWQTAIPHSYAEMKREWDDLIIIPPSLTLHQMARGDYHEIDEWWDPQIEHYLEWLFKRQCFDVVLVNYAFLSKALQLAPKITIKILDTHDLFAGRKELLAKHGVAPEFFYTTEEQEKIAFDRADIILAIKDSEREIIRLLTRQTVLSLPYYPTDPPAPEDPERAAGNGELQRLRNREEVVVGFIGAENSVNIVNISRFVEEMTRLLPIYTPPLRIVIAGNVCRQLWSDNPAVELVGRVEDIRDFYEAVDVVVAPLAFSTGIKIKVGEALAYGKPVVSTANGFDGYLAFDEFHRLRDIPAVCRALIKIALDRPRLALLEERSAMAARMAELATSGGLDKLESALQNRVRRILFVTDQPFWRRDTLQHERLYQWYELLSFLAPIICVAIGEDSEIPLNTGDGPMPGYIVQATAAPGSLPGASVPRVEEVVSSIAVYGKLHVVISAHPALAAQVKTIAEPSAVTVAIDLWGDADLVDDARNSDLLQLTPSAPDLSLANAASDPDLLTATPLRYLPAKLGHWNEPVAGQGVLLVLCSVDRGLQIDLDFVISRLRLQGDALTVVSGEGDPLADISHREFLSWAATVGRIGRMILIGSDQRMLGLYRAVAAYLKLPCDEIASGRFPFLHSDAQGQTVLVNSVPGLLERLLSFGSEARAAYTHDAGWSVVWRTLEAA